MASTVLLFDLGNLRHKWGWFLALGIAMPGEVAHVSFQVQVGKVDPEVSHFSGAGLFSELFLLNFADQRSPIGFRR